MDIELVWPNKDRTLYASGALGYEWLTADDPRLRKPLKSTYLNEHDGAPGRSNILAVGDGLDVLEALSSTSDALAGGIRLLYIDPPFNTGKTFRQYGDSLQRAVWLSMMRDRLAAVKPHLAPDASVWVHLDDSEVHRARAVMDEVFGEAAFVASVIWQKKTTRDSRAAFSTNHDTILVYAPAGPRAWKTSRNLLVKDEALLQNRDDDPRGPWSDAPFTAPGYRANQQYDIIAPAGNTLRPPRGRSWYATRPTFEDLVAEDRIWFPKNGSGSPRLKLFAHQLRGLVPFSVWGAADTGTNDDAKRHLLELFPDREVFDTPKPESLLERIVHIATNPDDLVVDLFAGSGTTAAVAHKMRRRWIAVERSAQTVIDFTYPRMHRVVSGQDFGGISHQLAWVGGGAFDVLHVAPRLGVQTGQARPATLSRALGDRAPKQALPRVRPA
ncbi:site-specific DNA-methyltransferase [Rathayibacter festucae]|uniref:site-specific DNA-methyltransferase n=1 Tax=Rathayibacter festucae TaxID=110937 RepID=UPI001FB4E78A|nr:site-specific DNA-methyltransferase [Rathayibacter festucae]MCJ1702135.1 site-specific DNA-methyltransferase [Rathayibacter festucae]